MNRRKFLIGVFGVAALPLAARKEPSDAFTEKAFLRGLNEIYHYADANSEFDECLRRVRTHISYADVNPEYDLTYETFARGMSELKRMELGTAEETYA